MRCGSCRRTATLAGPGPDGARVYRCEACSTSQLAAWGKLTPGRWDGGAAVEVEVEAPAPGPPGEGRLLTAAEASMRLSLSRSSVLRLARRGEIQTVRVGRSVRLSEGAVDRFLRKHRRGL